MGWLQRLLGRGGDPGAGPLSAPAESAGAPSETVADALVDALTGLGNRLRLNEHLQAYVDQSPATGPRPALLLIDVDRFDSVNDAVGPGGGDEVLRHVSQRLYEVSGGAGAYRAGGDRFALLIDGATEETATAAAEAVRELLRRPVEASGTAFEMTASIAVVMLGDRLSADAVLHDADVTMFRAKAMGGDRTEVYAHDTDDWAMARKRDVESLLREVEELRLENQMLSEAMLVDPATGLPNGASFDADLQQLHARRSRQGDPYTVLVAEIDEFDSFCETYGRPGRQRALRCVAESLRDTVRQTDRAYRYGPHEFAVLLPGCDGRQGVAAGERVRSGIERMALEHSGRRGAVLSVSVGVVEAGFRHSSAKDVLKEVGEMIAAAKAAGGNRVVWPH